ncbi:OB-fold domain-containing protein [Candidatus Nitrosotenuis chungbukensis]
MLDGIGTVATYTIITVPPAGFEKYTPYALGCDEHRQL